jgi:hypothetical protein
MNINQVEATVSRGQITCPQEYESGGWRFLDDAV